jgi:iron complex transport system substrate-binding protein
MTLERWMLAAKREAVALNWHRCSLMAALVSCALLMQSVYAFEVVDDRGQTVRLARPAQRIVSLLPSLTETVCALGQCARLVGVDRYSNFPDSVNGLPKLGGGLDPNIEAIVALKPDLVLMATSAHASERLEALGVKVLTLEPKSHADVKRLLDVMGSVLGVDESTRAWQKIDQSIQRAAQAVPTNLKGSRVYFEVNRAPYAASESSFIGETLKRLDLNNIVPARLGQFPLLNPEFVVRGNPDVIMVGDVDYAGMGDRPGWHRLRAIADGRVCVFTPAQADVLVRAGPRIAEGAQLMVQCLQKVMK